MDSVLLYQIQKLFALKAKFPQGALNQILAFMPHFKEPSPGTDIEIDSKTEKYLELLMMGYAKGCIEHQGVLKYFIYLLENIDHLKVPQPIGDSACKVVASTLRRIRAFILSFFNCILKPEVPIPKADRSFLALKVTLSLTTLQDKIINYLQSEITREKEGKTESAVLQTQKKEGVLQNLLEDYPNYPELFNSMNKDKIVVEIKKRIEKIYKDFYLKDKKQDQTPSYRKYITQEIYSLIGVVGSQEFSSQPSIMKILIELSFFNLFSNASSKNYKVTNELLSEISGYFSFFQASEGSGPQFDVYPEMVLEASQPSGPPGSDMTCQATGENLSVGLKDILDHVIEHSKILSKQILTNFAQIVKHFLSAYKVETECHKVLKEATEKVFRLEEMLISEKTEFQGEKYNLELSKIRLLRSELTKTLVQSYANIDIKFSNSEQKDKKIGDKNLTNSIPFLTNMLLDIYEEESILDRGNFIAPQTLQNNEIKTTDKEKQFSPPRARDESSGPSSKDVLLYKHRIQTILDICSLKRSQLYFKKVYHSKLSVSQLLQALTFSKSPCHSAFYSEILKMMALVACESGQTSLITSFISQICFVLNVRQFQDLGDGQALDKLFNALDELFSQLHSAFSKSSSVILALYNGLIMEYVKVRIDEDPFGPQWMKSSLFLMKWVSKFYSQLNKTPHLKEDLQNSSSMTLKFWLFVVVDLPQLDTLPEDVELRNFCNCFSNLTEPSERIYTNSFLSSHLFLPQEIPASVFLSINKYMKKRYPRYFDKISGLRPAETMYLYAILMIIVYKIELIRDSPNPSEVPGIIGAEGSILCDILGYLRDMTLYNKVTKNLQLKMEKLLKMLADEYIEHLAKLEDTQIQMELAHRDFIILCQFCLSNSRQFAALARRYLIVYFQRFCPLFFKQGVIQTLCFCIDKISARLNLNYSNITELLEFPYFSQSILVVPSKDSLNQALSLFLSVLTNMYFVAFLLSRYLTKSVIENYSKASQDLYADEKLGKQYLLYLNQLEPELKDQNSKKKNRKGQATNFFLKWNQDNNKFYSTLKFQLGKLSDFLKAVMKVYQKEEGTVSMIDFKSQLQKVPQNENNYLEHFVGALGISEGILNKKLKELSVSCTNLELCILLRRLNTNQALCFEQLPSYIQDKIDDSIKDLLHRSSSRPAFRTALDGQIVQREKKILEDLSFMLNLSRSKEISELDLLDRIVNICSQYFLPSIFKYLLSQFVPALMRDEEGFSYDSLLIKLQRLVKALVNQFNGTLQGFQALNETHNSRAPTSGKESSPADTGSHNQKNLQPEESSSIMVIRSQLFSSIYKMSSCPPDSEGPNSTNNEPSKPPSGSYIPSLIEGNCRLASSSSVISPSDLFDHLYALKLEKDGIDCINHVASFLQKFMPVFFIKIRRTENLLIFFKVIFKLDYRAVRKIDLSAFCELNLSFLQFWSILVLKIGTKSHPHVTDLMSTMKSKFFSFLAHYFAYGISTDDCYKEFNEIDSMEEVIKNITSLYDIHQAITSFNQTAGKYSSSSENLQTLNTETEHDYTYWRTFKKSSNTDPSIDCYTKRYKTPMTVSKISSLLGMNQVGLNSQNCYLQLTPFLTCNNLADRLQRTVLNLIASEIEKIKGFFYTKFKHHPEFPDLLSGGNVLEKEFEADTITLFWVNPMSAYAYANRLFSELKTRDEMVLTRIFGPIITKCAEVFIHHKDFLPHFIEYLVEYQEQDMHKANVIMFWEMPFIPLVLKYAGQKYETFPILSNFFAKTMMRISANQLSFYLSQIFQSLDYAASEIIEDFMVKYAESSPLFAHQVIWMARVEEKADTNEELKKNQKKREVASRLPMKIIKGMGIAEKKFWDEVDSFYEQITKISSILEPKMPKPTKKEIINQKLDIIKMPPLVYLPTNPDFRVNKIKVGSGNPMQSAAKCPIWVSFCCKKFEGPDKYFYALKRDQKNMDSQIMIEDMEERVGNEIVEKMLQKSISYKDKSVVSQTPVLFSDKPSVGKQDTLKLDSMIEELFPQLIHKKESSLTPRGLFAGSDEKRKKKSTNLANEEILLAAQSRGKRRQSSTYVGPKLPEEQNEETEETVVSCIFKTFDDIRRDNLSLQVIRIFQEVFEAEKLDLFLFPYKTISTRTGNDKTIGGVIEVVPNTVSRDQIGKENKYGLVEFFREKYGSDQSTLFQEARENFIKSMAAYSVVSYILQIKDRHNGNILIDSLGHLIHIDFGFIFDISPGGNLKFERAEFKLTKEMISIMGGNKRAEPFRMYVDNTIRAFLAVRKYRELIIDMVELITKSSLGCFNERSIVSLRERFMEDKNDYQAARKMKKNINTAYKNLRTYLYDQIQWMQNRIER